jgi:hypothetical protein
MLGKRSIVVAVAVALAGVIVPVLATADEPVGIGVDPDLQCVGNPPRQTFDPYSPPCVPFYDGDNGGATAPGVTANEIRVLVYMQGNINYTSGSDPSNRTAPGNQIYDLREPVEQCRQRHSGSAGCDHLTVRALRVWQDYFDRRFQTYGRSVRLFVQFTEGVGITPERQRADWALALEQVDPFAVVPLFDVADTSIVPYLEAVEAAGRVAFTQGELFSDQLLDTLAPHLWSWNPSVDILAANYASEVCAQVVGQPPTRAGLVTGDPYSLVFEPSPRRLGLLWTTSPEHRNLARAAEVVREAVGNCGGSFVEEASFNECCLAHDGGDLPDEALRAMREMRLAGVTTILWPGGINGNMPRAATALNYEPEWVLMGDGSLDNSAAIFFSAASPAFNGRAGVVTHRVPERAGDTPTCERAFREIDKAYADSDLSYTCEYYRPLFLAFMAIQVAGPNLAVSQVDQGLRAIPATTGAPDLAATSFTSDDRSYVDDATAEWWDATAVEQRGCYRTIGGGGRHPVGGWPDHNWGSDWDSGDACDTWSSSTRMNLT